MTRRLWLIAALVIIAGVAKWQMKAIDVTTTASLGQLPFDFGAWHGRRAADYSPGVLAALGVDDYVNRSYAADDGRHANLYVGYYRSQEQGASIHSPLNCLPGAGWELERVARVPLGHGTARQVVARKGLRRYVAVYWYQTPTRIEGDEYRSRLYAAFDTVRYHRNDAALVRIMVPIGDGPGADGQAGVEAFELARLVMPDVQRLLFPPVSRTLPGRAGPA